MGSTNDAELLTVVVVVVVIVVVVVVVAKVLDRVIVDIAGCRGGGHKHVLATPFQKHWASVDSTARNTGSENTSHLIARQHTEANKVPYVLFCSFHDPNCG